ncbi:MAG: hypothetical protein PHO66_00215 [Eubacteriales bacterium]|nr:hypothetical protein [Eubacteriales bacterium]
MKKTFVMAVSVDARQESSAQLQQILTANGKMINLRCGSHDSGSEQGLIILKLKGARDRISGMNNSLNDIEGVSSKYMEI